MRKCGRNVDHATVQLPVGGKLLLLSVATWTNRDMLLCHHSVWDRPKRHPHPAFTSFLI